MNKRILVIDSGIGGITTLAAIRQKLLKVDIIYFADDLFLPYGNKTAEELAMHLCDVISCFEDEICAVVLACNTATGVAVEFLRKIFAFPIVGTEPAVALACKTPGKCLALVTPLEAEQNKFKRLISGKPVLVLQRPNLALEIDDFLLKSGSVCALDGCNAVMEDVLDVERCAKERGVLKIVLGCTHYVFLKHAGLFEGFELFDGNEGVAKRAQLFVKDLGSGETEFVFGSGSKKKSQIALGLLNELLLNF